MTQVRAVAVQEAADAELVQETVVLDFHHRHRRRILMRTESRREFLLDLDKARALRHNDVLVLDDDSQVRVVAADEPVMRITAEDAHTLMRLAWHIGNRHLPAEIHDQFLLLAEDHVIAQMVEGLGGRVTRERRPFQPEGGAYDHGH